MKKYFIIAILIGWFISFIGFFGLMLAWLKAALPYIREALHKIRCHLRR